VNFQHSVAKNRFNLLRFDFRRQRHLAIRIDVSPLELAPPERKFGGTCFFGAPLSDYIDSMPQILTEVVLPAQAIANLEALPGVSLRIIPPHEGRWELGGEFLRGTEILLCKFPPGNLDHMADLKLLHISTVGYEHLRNFGLAGKPLRVCNARGIFDTAIAEWNLAMMVNLVRDLRRMLHNQDQARWERLARFEQELRGRVLGLWGYGGIGRETARLAKAFGMKVQVMTRSGVGPRPNVFVQPGAGDPEGKLPDRVFVTGQEREFLSRLDFLVLALPRTRQSNGMIGERELRALPPEAFILNPSRGPIIQEQALLQALKEGWIAGAALDTHFIYPLPPEHPLWRFPNVILTPHISGGDDSSSFPARMAELFRQNVIRYVEGQPLLNEVTAEEWREI
jgi:phosphoglycerate dehydrogenase-like enzyme